MKTIELAYGRSGLTIIVPDEADVITSKFYPGLEDEAGAILRALREPAGTTALREQVRPGDAVVIVHSDLTRATPNARILPVILEELESAGVRRQDITLINGLGTHRPQTAGEMRRLLGDFIVDNYRCLQHDAFNDELLVPLGTTALGNPVRINKHFLEADMRILTGFIEPHFFAGFSGGPKGVLPALAGFESVLSNHGWEMIGHPGASWGICEGNPIWEEMREVALKAEPTFLLNVALNSRHEITAVFAGDILEAHRAGREFVRRQSMAEISAPYDIVISSNSGYPLDQSLYQSVKGMSAAARAVREGGTIIMAAACEDGLPDHGLYAALLAQANSPAEVLTLIEDAAQAQHDQWQVQIQAQVQLKADVYVYSDGLSSEQIRRALFKPCSDIEATLQALQDQYGHGARLCVMPEGPQTVAFLKQ
ncbi:MAG: nickel-dependent lactate racemase [Candidatus Promineifilaceae bacterium]|nr:nickel-dependent lactate racemase [Candidatus Promineifilaceae bacterium]